MTLRHGLMLINGLLFLWIIIRVASYKRELHTFRPDRKIKHTLPNTILTRVS